MKKTAEGWESRFGVVLKERCVKCSVWVGRDDRGRKIDFDGFPHKTDCTKGHKNVTSVTACNN